MSSLNAETEAAFTQLLGRASTDAERATLTEWRNKGREPDSIHYDEMASELNNNHKLLGAYDLFFGNVWRQKIRALLLLLRRPSQIGSALLLPDVRIYSWSLTMYRP
jgi:hypothetical protein